MTAASAERLRPNPDAADDRRTAAAVGVGLLLVYMAVSRREYVAYDAQAMIAVAKNLVDHGTLQTTGAFDDVYKLNTPYAQYGIAVSLLAVPAYIASKVFGHVALLLSMVNPVVTAVTGALVYLIGRTLRWQRGASVLAAATFGLLTVALQSTTELFSEPGVGLCEVAMVLALLRWRLGSRWAPLVLGVSLGAVIQFRQDSMFTVWVGMLAVPLFVPWRSLWRRTTIAAVGVPVAVSLAFTFWYNELRWGRPLASSYGGVGFHTPLERGLGGLLLSPGKSLFVFNPIALLGLVGLAWLMAGRDRALGVLALLLIVPRVFFFAKWDAWEGGLSWGPRFLTPVVALLVILAVDVLVGTSPNAVVSAVARTAFVVLAAASVVVSFLSVRVPYEQWYGALYFPEQRVLYERGRPLLRYPDAPNAVIDAQTFTVRASPLVGNYRLIEQGTARMAPAFWRRGEATLGWTFAAGGLAVIALAAAVPPGRLQRKRPPAHAFDDGGAGSDGPDVFGPSVVPLETTPTPGQPSRPRRSRWRPSGR